MMKADSNSPMRRSAPASSLLLGLVTDVPLLIGFDQLGSGVIMHVNILASTEMILLDVPSAPDGYGHVTTGIPNSPALVGKHYYFQSLSYWGGSPCNPSPIGLSSSLGLDILIQ